MVSVFGPGLQVLEVLRDSEIMEEMTVDTKKDTKKSLFNCDYTLPSRQALGIAQQLLTLTTTFPFALPVASFSKACHALARFTANLEQGKPHASTVCSMGNSESMMASLINPRSTSEATSLAIVPDALRRNRW